MSSHMENPLPADNILNLIDSFIEQMLKITNILKLMSISSLIMIMIALGVTMYIIYHPLFISLLTIDSEFRLTLYILIASILGIFSMCIINAIRQYKIINSWNKRYQAFILRKYELDKKIGSRAHIGQQDKGGIINRSCLTRTKTADILWEICLCGWAYIWELV